MSFDGKAMGVGEALRRGFSMAAKAPGVLALGLAARLSATVLEVSIATSLAALALAAVRRALLGASPLSLLEPEALAEKALGRLLGTALPPLAAAALAAWLLALALRLLWAAAGAAVFERRLRGQPPASALAAGAGAFGRAAAVGLLLLPAGLAVRAYAGVAIGSAGYAWVHAAATGSGGAVASAAAALALVLGLVLSQGFGLFAQLAVVRAVAAGERATHALASAARLLGRRAGALAAVWLVFALAGLIPAFVGASGGGLLLGASTAAAALLAGVRAAMVAVAEAGSAFLDSAQLGALAALAAERRGAVRPLPPLPAARATEPVLATETVLEAQAVEASEPG